MRNKIISIILFSLFIFTSSCSTIAKTFSTPTYSIHSIDKIKLEKKSNNQKRIFIVENSNSSDNFYKDIIVETKKQFSQKENINIVDNPNKADYVINLKIRNIATDVDYDVANNIRNSLLLSDTQSEYIFDNNNSPHINKPNQILVSGQQPKFGRNWRMAVPSVLYTTIGAGAGFYLGFLFAGSFSPLAIGTITGIAFGTTTYLLYNTFKRTGVIITYDIEIDEKKDKVLSHNKKIISKVSSNMSDELYYSYSDNYLNYISKYIIIGIGSRVLQKEIQQEIKHKISNSIVDVL